MFNKIIPFQNKKQTTISRCLREIDQAFSDQVIAIINKHKLPEVLTEKELRLFGQELHKHIRTIISNNVPRKSSSTKIPVQKKEARHSIKYLTKGDSTKGDIKIWFNNARRDKATHLIIVYNIVERTDLPVAVYPGTDPRHVVYEYNQKEMHKVLEVYNLNKPFKDQFSTSVPRSWNY